jgi:hypothetical protein
MNATDAEVLRDMALSRIRKAAVTSELPSVRLAYLLYRWRDFAEDGGAESITPSRAGGLNGNRQRRL